MFTIMEFKCTIYFITFFITVCSARRPFRDRTDDNFQNECVSSHNEYRGRHNAPAIGADQRAILYAKSRCRRISRHEGLSHGHSGLQGYGENLYWGGHSSSHLYGCKSAVDSWYNEVNQYDYNSPGFSGSTGHFTQVVWRSSTGLGCARCGGRGRQWHETYIVCNYSPPGNFIGRFEENVLRP